MGIVKQQQDKEASKDSRGSEKDKLWMVDITILRDHAIFSTENAVFGIGSNAYLQLGITSPNKNFDQPVQIFDKAADFVSAGFRQSYIIR